jgi:hypothetical protein
LQHECPYAAANGGGGGGGSDSVWVGDLTQISQHVFSPVVPTSSTHTGLEALIVVFGVYSSFNDNLTYSIFNFPSCSTILDDAEIHDLSAEALLDGKQIEHL